MPCALGLRNERYVMVHTFNAEQRAKFFDNTFATTQLDLLKKGEISHLHPRDRILLNILEKQPGGIRILDYGCGQGRLLGELLSRGYDAYGYEPSRGMADIAAKLFVTDAQFRIFVGPEDVLKGLSGQKFDLVLLMGVMQYVSDEERAQLFDRCRGYLHANGTLVATFQNGLFDLFTFNKYTVDCLVNMLLHGQLSGEEAALVQGAVEGLLMNPVAPPFSPSRARDNVFVRLSNPLIAKQDLKAFGFELQTLSFYEWFGLPPLLSGQLGNISKRIKEHFEVIDASDWRGHFMANAFLVTAVPR